MKWCAIALILLSRLTVGLQQANGFQTCKLPRRANVNKSTKIYIDPHTYLHNCVVLGPERRQCMPPREMRGGVSLPSTAFGLQWWKGPHRSDLHTEPYSEHKAGFEGPIPAQSLSAVRSACPLMMSEPLRETR